MTFNTSSARKLNNFFLLTCITSIRLQLATKQFETKPIYLALNILGIVAQTLYILIVGVSRQLLSKWYSTATTFVDTLAIFLRDLLFFFCYPIIILILHSSRSKQTEFLNKTIAFHRHMNDCFGHEPLLLRKHFTGTWVKCVVWIVYYNVCIVPIGIYLNKYTFEIVNVIYFGCYSLVMSGIGQAMSYIELCITICFRQTDRLHRAVDNSLAKVDRDANARAEAIKGMDMIRYMEELRQYFDSSFANALYFICQMVTINSVFLLYLTMQRIATSHFEMQTLDIIIYFLPLIVRVFRLIGRMQEFATEVSIVKTTYGMTKSSGWTHKPNEKGGSICLDTNICWTFCLNRTKPM